MTLGLIIALIGISPIQTKASERVYGEDRYKTAVAISQAGWAQADTVILVRGDDFPDALCAGPYAGLLGGPILLTRADRMEPEVIDEIKRLATKRVVLIGGTSAISENVAEMLRKAGIDRVERIGGKDRYETSALIAAQMGKCGEVAVATGLNFPDALSISPIATSRGMPILLTEKEHLPESIRAYLAGKKLDRTYVIGGNAVIEEGQLDEFTNPIRLAGKDRYETNVVVLDYFNSHLDYSTLYVAVGGGERGNEFADALTGSVLAAKNRFPLVLCSRKLPENTAEFLKSVLDPYSKLIAFGGVNAVSVPVMESLEGLIASPSVSSGGGGGGGGRREKVSPLFAGGRGTEDDPYQIATAEQLERIKNHLGDHFILIENIDLGDYLAGAGCNGGAGWQPIGNAESPFSGSFDGNGMMISNLKIERSNENNVGLFGVNESFIANVSLIEVEVKGRNCVGALVGHNRGGTVARCSATGAVNGDENNVGGLIGKNSNGGMVSECYSVASVAGAGSGAHGGLVGKNDGSRVERSFAVGNVEGNWGVGGLVGETGNGAEIIGCYATGAVDGGNCIGGLAGSSQGDETKITCCYAVGLVTGDHAGGLIGCNDGALVEKSYWNTETSGQDQSAGGEGKNSAEMMDQSTFEDWDFESDWEVPEGTYPHLHWQPEVHVLCHPFAGGEGTAARPYQIATAAQLDRVRDYWDKYFIQLKDLDLEDYLAEEGFGYDDGKGWQPIGTDSSPFTGSYDGDGYTISNLQIKRPEDYNNPAGLFGNSSGSIFNLKLSSVYIRGANYIGGLIGKNSGSVRDIFLTEVDIYGFGSYVGGLIGENKNGTIENSHVSGSVEGIQNVGGLIGSNDGSQLIGAEIKDCSAAGSVIGTRNVIGGLIGNNHCVDIYRCFSTSDVTSDETGGFDPETGLYRAGQLIGGLVGYGTYGHISECFATGAVKGYSEVGGLVGEYYCRKNDPREVSDCYATGAVSGSSKTGGFVGYLGSGDPSGHAVMARCYAVGKVVGSETTGGLVGEIGRSFDVENSYWDTDTSEQAGSAVGTGKSTAEMMEQSTFEGWDFTNIWAINSGSYAINPGSYAVNPGSYPYLRWQ